MSRLRVEDNQSACDFEHELQTCMKNNSTDSSDQPSFVDGDHELVTVLSGDDAILPCRLTVDIGDLEITWIKQNPVQLLSNTRNPRFIVRREGNRTFDLHIASVGLPDESVYICQLNTGIPTSRRVELMIRRPPSLEAINYGDTPINLNDEIPVITINETESFFVDCVITGFPPPLTQWISLVKDTEVSMNMQYVSANEAIRLVADNASRDDSGLYICRARNPYGKVEKRIRLVVQYKPSISPLEPLIYSGLTSNIKIDCQADASPPASYEWTKESEDGEKRVTAQRSLIVKLDESDYGFYTCTATNLLGTAENTLEICGRPRRPTILSPATSLRRRAYELVWASNTITPFGTNLNIDEFIVEYRPLNTPKTLDNMGHQLHFEWYQAVIPFVSDSETISHVIRDLFANTTYELFLYGRNSLGNGEGARCNFTTSVSDMSVSDPVNGERKADFLIGFISFRAGCPMPMVSSIHSVMPFLNRSFGRQFLVCCVILHVITVVGNVGFMLGHDLHCSTKFPQDRHGSTPRPPRSSRFFKSWTSRPL